MVLSMDRWKGKVAIVTGAGSGIGAATAKQLLEDGLQVVAIDIRADFLENLSKTVGSNKGNLHNFTLDVSQDEEVKQVFKKITTEVGPVHILVNCAGIVQQTDLIGGDTEKWRKVMNVNVIGLSIMTREAIEVMSVNKIDGHIVHICSVTGHMVPAGPGINMYPASKHAVKALTETLRQEFNRLGLKIKISSVSPGCVKTGIINNNDFKLDEWNEMVKLNPEDIADATHIAFIFLGRSRSGS